MSESKREELRSLILAEQLRKAEQQIADLLADNKRTLAAGFGATEDNRCHSVPEMMAGMRAKEVAGLEATVERIQHFATGSCDMDATTRLRCIAKECEAAKAAGGDL